MLIVVNHGWWKKTIDLDALQKGENIGAGINPYTLPIQLVFPEPVASFICKNALPVSTLHFLLEIIRIREWQNHPNPQKTGRLSSNAETFISVPLVTFSSPAVIWVISEGRCQPYLVDKPKWTLASPVQP